MLLNMDDSPVQYTYTAADGSSQEIPEGILDAVVTTVKKGGAVSIPGFGSFKQHARAAHPRRLLPMTYGASFQNQMLSIGLVAALAAPQHRHHHGCRSICGQGADQF